MSTTTEVAIPEEVSAGIAQIENLDTPQKRFEYLSGTFASAIVVIAEMQKNRDWEHLTHEDGSPYTSLTDLVSDALSKSDSYSRRLVQTANEFYTPLESITVEGTVISITATEAASLGTEGMRDVVDRVNNGIDGEESPEGQSALIDSAKAEVLSGGSDVGFDDDEFSGGDLADLGDDDFDDDDGLDYSDSGGQAPSRSGGTDASLDDLGSDFDPDDSDFGDDAPKEKPEKPANAQQDSSDFLTPIQQIMAGGQTYKTDEDIETLPDDLQKFVRAVNYLAELEPVELAEMIDEDKRGVTYEIRTAISALRLVVSATETSGWVVQQL